MVRPDLARARRLCLKTRVQEQPAFADLADAKMAWADMPALRPTPRIIFALFAALLDHMGEIEFKKLAHRSESQSGSQTIGQ